LRVAILLLACGVARADEAAQHKAHLLSDEGMERFRSGDYDAAIAAFQAANAIAPRPILLFNLGQAYRLKGDCQPALAHYRAYLAALPDAGNRQKVEAFVANLPCASEPIASPSPSPQPQPIEPWPESVTPVPRVVPLVEVYPPPRPKPARATLSARGGRAGGATLFLVGGALVGTAGAFSARALQASRDVSALFDSGAKWTDDAAIEQRGHDADTVAISLYVTGGVLAAAGVAFLAVGGRRLRAAKMSLAPTLGGAVYACDF
jgi:tetratricopeptide (TPR) repeat protein